MALDLVFRKVMNYIAVCIEGDGLGVFACVLKDNGQLTTIFPETEDDFGAVYKSAAKSVVVHRAATGVFVNQLRVLGYEAGDAIGMLCWEGGVRSTKIIPYSVANGKVTLYPERSYDGHDMRVVQSSDQDSIRDE